MKNINNYYIFVFFLYLSLLFGLYTNEDLLGGASIDYNKILLKLDLLKNLATLI